MPFSFRNSDPEARGRLLARVRAGERLCHVCAEAGMPSHATVRLWRRTQPGFAGDLERARVDGQWRREAMPDAAVAKALLARLAAGEAISAILRDPAMPSRRIFELWRRQHSDFAEEVWRLYQIKFQERAQRCARRYRPFDPRLADRIVARVARDGSLERVLRADPELPSKKVVLRWRRERKDFDEVLRHWMSAARRGRAPVRLCTPAMTEAVCARLRRGRTLAQVGLEPGMPCQPTLYGWMKRRRDFREAVVAAWRARAEDLADAVMEACEDRATLSGRGRELAAIRRKVEALDAKAGRWAAWSGRL